MSGKLQLFPPAIKIKVSESLLIYKQLVGSRLAYLGEGCVFVYKKIFFWVVIFSFFAGGGVPPSKETTDRPIALSTEEMSPIGSKILSFRLTDRHIYYYFFIFY